MEMAGVLRADLIAPSDGQAARAAGVLRAAGSPRNFPQKQPPIESTRSA
jgi:hypothetical protein